ncbi:MAG: hypothetical protein JXA60_09420 [Candidatus Coatesbacteria bacterium]|nr:hypothetical protein [Candidatus Coatesbacteria bacterium]
MIIDKAGSLKSPCCREYYLNACELAAIEFVCNELMQAYKTCMNLY